MIYVMLYVRVSVEGHQFPVLLAHIPCSFDWRDHIAFQPQFQQEFSLYYELLVSVSSAVNTSKKTLQQSFSVVATVFCWQACAFNNRSRGPLNTDRKGIS